MPIGTGFFIVCIVALGGLIAVTVLKIILGQQRRKDDPIAAQQMRNLQTQVDDLNRRLANVETITTSRDFHLNREFEELSRK